MARVYNLATAKACYQAEANLRPDLMPCRWHRQQGMPRPPSTSTWAGDATMWLVPDRFRDLGVIFEVLRLTLRDPITSAAHMPHMRQAAQTAALVELGLLHPSCCTTWSMLTHMDKDHSLIM